MFISHTTFDNIRSVAGFPRVSFGRDSGRCEEVNARAINVGPIRQPAPKLVERYIRAFEKGWVHRDHLGKA